jgi:hypothetical protein
MAFDERVQILSEAEQEQFYGPPAFTSADRLQCIIGTQIYGSGEADIPTMTSDWVIADI